MKNDQMHLSMQRRGKSRNLTKSISISSSALGVAILWADGGRSEAEPGLAILAEGGRPVFGVEGAAGADDMSC